MADAKIVDLPPLVVQALTDIRESSANGLLSSKETRAQELAFMQLNLAFLSSSLPTAELFVGDAGGSAAPVAMSGDASLDSSGALTLSTVLAASGPYGAADKSLNLTLNEKGLVTNASENLIQIAESQVTDLTTNLAAKLDLSGGTMTGLLELSADPINPLGAATKQYVDSAAGDIQTITGTVNQIIVDDTDPENIELSTPQDIAPISSPEFKYLTIKDVTNGNWIPEIIFAQDNVPVPLQVLGQQTVIGRNTLNNPIYYSQLSAYPTLVDDNTPCTGLRWDVLSQGNTRAMLIYDGLDATQGADGLATLGVPIKFTASTRVSGDAVAATEVVPLQQLNAGLGTKITSVSGVANQIIVNSVDPLNIILETPQDIAPASSPTFTGGTYTGDLEVTSTTVASTALLGALVIGDGVDSVGIGGGKLSTTGSITAGTAVTVGAAGQFTLIGREPKRLLATDTSGTVKVSNLVTDIDIASPVINSAQNSFTAYRSTTLTDVVGDSATPYIILYNATESNKGSPAMFNAGVITVRRAGKYKVSGYLALAGLTNQHDVIRLYIMVNGVNRYDLIDTSSAARDTNNQWGDSFAESMVLALNDIITVNIIVNGGPLTVDLFGAPLTGTRNTFSMDLIS